MQGKARRCWGTWMAYGAACVLVMAGIGVYGMWNAVHAQDTPDLTIRVATYEPQTVFSQSHLQNELLQSSQRISAAMEQAQQQGDQDAMQQLQLQFRSEQERIVGEFEDGLKEIMPAIAREEGLQLVAVDVIYQQDNVQTRDITQDVVQKMNANAPEGSAPAPPQPQLQLQQ
jgi:hypothetical protein